MSRLCKTYVSQFEPSLSWLCYLFTEFDNVGEKLSLVNTNDVIGSFGNDVSQISELCGRNGGQRLFVVSGDGLAVVTHIVSVLDDEAGVASDLRSNLRTFYHDDRIYQKITFTNE